MAEKSYFSAKDIPQELNPGFEVTAFYDPKFGSFAAGAHIVVVDVDPKTGQVEIVRYVAAEDVGTVINPAVVEGQIIGGIAQGIGEALLEELVYDEAGQPRTVTLADYLDPLRLGDSPDRAASCQHAVGGARRLQGLRRGLDHRRARRGGLRGRRCAEPPRRRHPRVPGDARSGC